MQSERLQLPGSWLKWYNFTVQQENMKKYLLVITLVMTAAASRGQESLFGPGSAKKKHSGFILVGNVSGDMPLLDMAKRFSYDYRVGAGVNYKTERNWIFGVKYDFLLGNKIKEDSFVINIVDKYSGPFNGKVFQALNINGNRVGVPVYERGYLAGVQVGKILPLKKNEKDNGLLLMTTVGMIQHRINIFNKDGDVPAIQGDYVKGYDRLTRGMFLEQYAGYVYFAKNEFLNFSIGLDIAWGFTKGQRAYLFDVGHADTRNRNDVMFGIRGSWMLPIFKRKSEDISFE